MSDFDLPDVGEYIKLTFEGEHGSQSPIKGRVTDVDTDTDGIPQTDFIITIDSSGKNHKRVMYSEGDDENGDRQAVVTRSSDYSGSHRLGENAEWTRLE